MKKYLVFALVVLLIGALTTGVMTSAALAGGIDNPKGIPLYVIIEVTWDGSSADGDWTVWGPLWEPEVGHTILAGPLDLAMDYTFTFHGKTVHFDEVYVPRFDATPQIRHVVLRDLDGDRIYTGSLSAQHYTSEGTGSILYMDRIDYDIEFDAEGNCIDFHYLQYEHKKLVQ